MKKLEWIYDPGNESAMGICPMCEKVIEYSHAYKLLVFQYTSCEGSYVQVAHTACIKAAYNMEDPSMEDPSMDEPYYEDFNLIVFRD